MSTIAIKAKRLYKIGALSKTQIEAMFNNGKITEEELRWILDLE